jgi:N utilization substance protein A
MVDATPEDFGRIAAQTAKQVILQRMREAEREAQYQEYLERLDDILTGTVQSQNNDVITLSLGRAEAILPRSQQMPGERYRMHDKVRAYVMEVRRTNRGPQIVVSRTHRNMLRRLLEYEVPEIYNGTVEIKSIAREPGHRSKVAVYSNQPGADPVGACVGMRGVRIQSIVKELGGEKIDVIEWNADNSVFISKALSPARVSHVFLDDDPDQGRTATVVVPDDQLSLAIGRAGQNARLAAKLTGWRIDIKSVSEAGQDAYETIQEQTALAAAAGIDGDVFAQVQAIMLKKVENRPVMPEEYLVLSEFINQLERYRLQLREHSRKDRRAEIAELRAQIPDASYEVDLSESDLPLSVYNLLTEAGFVTVGQVLDAYYLHSESLETLGGYDTTAQEAVSSMAAGIEELLAELEAEVALAANAEVEAPLLVDSVEAPVQEAGAPAVSVEAEEGDVDWEVEDEEAKARREAIVRRMSGEPDKSPVESETDQAEVAAVAALDNLDDDSDEDSVVDYDIDDVDVEDMTPEERAEHQRKKAKQRRRQLVFDEDLGRVVAKRRRKRESNQAWDSEEDEYDY